MADVADSDEQLLKRFTDQNDTAAFEVLVRRHGPMVLHVCQRVLLDRHDAEDAFQATFLVLARKARAVGRPHRLANWLYGVAFRISLRARESKARRQRREGQLDPASPEKVSATSAHDATWRDLRPVLDEELSRLPEKYRAPLVLCYLQGKTTDQTADQLGWKRGTVAGRLSRARELLRNRLTRRGLALTPAVLGALLTQNTASAAALPGPAAAQATAAVLAMGAGQATATSAQAAAWADAAIRALWLGKVKTYVAGLVGVLLVAGAVAAIVSRPHEPPPTGFLNRVWMPGMPQESKYVVYVPRGYTGKTPYPVTLYLHGINGNGTDGQKQTRGELGAAIRKRPDFPMIAVFPQLAVGDWEPETPAARRALAILDQVERDFNVDRKRIYLTGWSLGGFGAWSLGAAYPERWAAIAPVASGGDPRSAAKLVQMPIWAFHSEGDKLVPVRRDRDMIAAVRAAGGTPRYTEYPGGDHPSTNRAFETDELYQWLLQQRRP